MNKDYILKTRSKDISIDLCDDITINTIWCDATSIRNESGSRNIYGDYLLDIKESLLDYLDILEDSIFIKPGYLKFTDKNNKRSEERRVGKEC